MINFSCFIGDNIGPITSDNILARLRLNFPEWYSVGWRLKYKESTVLTLKLRAP